MQLFLKEEVLHTNNQPAHQLTMLDPQSLSCMPSSVQEAQDVLTREHLPIWFTMVFRI